MIACGKPTIATNYSGQTQFINKDNCMLLDVVSMLPAKDNVFFTGQGTWAQPDINRLEEYMEHCYKNKVTEWKNTVETGKKFSWTESGNKLIKILES